ncbi:hypothetical protein [Ruminococcus sp.]|uniref:hypothetical protein n=1 Tax=Ruminococcus sp. TaxID=41978 RepID=UPI0025DD92D3|nr:hypothetical protein [Ruminococcus sp.]
MFIRIVLLINSIEYKEALNEALNNVHERYHSLIQDALIEYEEDRNISYDTDHAKDYAKYMVNQIASLREM